ncbi:MAG: redox-regulated ATPase YchF [Bacteriovoracaceae bacterium]|nr:redox-regulated ATPase YchF [Bacteriovoracaceae bacterium]
MSFNCGIVGLPNVGKSTLFQALTSAPAEAANYPFCTIEPNVGIVAVPDERLEKITKFVTPERTIPSSVEFVDIAGLVKGASKGEGLGNQFLGHIRSVAAIVHVVRCFEDGNIIHVDGKVDPASDIGTITVELCLADLEAVQKRLANLDKFIKNQDKKISERAKISRPILEQLEKALGQGKAARSLGLSKEDLDAIQDLQLITMKPMLYCCNVDEESLSSGNKFTEVVAKIAKEESAEIIFVCAKIESEIAALETEAERKEFAETIGLAESGLSQLIRAAYRLIGLRTYFTAGVKEVRAWTFTQGMKAPQAAAVIHTDFEKGFIRAEVFHCEDLFLLGSEAKVKEAGKFRVEGKEYVVQDGDIMHFRFNV